MMARTLELVVYGVLICSGRERWKRYKTLRNWSLILAYWLLFIYVIGGHQVPDSIKAPDPFSLKNIYISLYEITQITTCLIK